MAATLTVEPTLNPEIQTPQHICLTQQIKNSLIAAIRSKSFKTLSSTIIIYSAFILLWVLLSATAFPKLIQSQDDGSQFSGENAVKHLHHLSQETHMYNSDGNFAVRNYIIRTLEKYQSPSIELNTSDNINLTTYTNWWYESNNVLVKIHGAKQSGEALLVSSHFDSTSVSNGATDDGIAVACMLELVRLLSIKNTLDHDVILNFNNGEEMGLLGGTAFLLHPWSKGIKGFINLEGTGAADNTKSLLFRTNSYELTRQYKNSVPYPHASILFNDIMQFVGSDTDYRPYTSIAGWPGIDIAFYSYRYLYHTPRDDIHHTSAISVQHMGNNLFSMVKYSCTDARLSKLSRKPTAKETDGVLASASFVFYDCLGSMMILFSHAGNLVIVSMLLVCTVAGFVAWNYFIERKGLRMYMIPTLKAYAIVWASVGMGLFLVYLLSMIKTAINPASSYGLPEINLTWIIPAILISYLIVESIFSVVYSNFDLNAYTLLPSAEEDMDELDRDLLPRDNTVGDWLGQGLNMFWCTTLLLSFFASLSLGVDGLYIATVWVFFSSVTLLIGAICRVLTREWVKAELSNPGTMPNWQINTIKVYDGYFGLIKIVLSNLIPFMVTLDLLEEVMVSLPSLIAENVSEPSHDLALALIVILLTINILPSFDKLTGKRFIFPLLFLTFTVPYIIACTSFPFTYNRPSKISFLHTWNVDSVESIVKLSTQNTMKTSTMLDHIGGILNDTWIPKTNCYGKSCEFTAIFPITTKNFTNDDLFEFKILHFNSTESDFINGEFIGTSKSRICSLDVDYKAKKDDEKFGIWLESDHLDLWKTSDNHHPFFDGERGMYDADVSRKAMLFKRELDIEEKMKTTFSIRFDRRKVAGKDIILIFSCYYGQAEFSGVYEKLAKNLPPFMTFQNGRFGELILVKNVTLTS